MTGKVRGNREGSTRGGAPPRWFWAVSGFGLVWNAVGVVAFVIQATMDLGDLPDIQRLYFETRPSWATASFGIAVASGVLGCLALLLRKQWAAPMLLLCLVAILVQVFHSLALSNGLEAFGPQGLVLPLGTLAIAVRLTAVARAAERRDWLG